MSSAIDGLLLGPLLHALGSMAMFLALRMFDVPEPSYELDEAAVANSPAASTTATMLVFFIMGFSVLAIGVQVAIHCRLAQVRREKAEADREYAEAEAERSLWERFFVPHFRPVNESTTDKLSWRWSHRARGLLLAPAVSLFLILVLRLFVGAADFEGVPENLDFGWKYGLVPHDREVEDGNDGLYNEPAEKSIAFVVEFNSYGHAMQGFFAAFLAFPAVARILRRPLGSLACCGRLGRNLVDLAPFGLSLYPTYSLLKRYIKAGEAFAGSSFTNNAFEWAAGFIMGLALGDLLTALALWRSVSDDLEKRSKDDTERDTSSDSEQESVSPPWWKFWEEDKTDTPSDKNEQEDRKLKQGPTCCIGMLQRGLGILFQLTVFASAVLFGLTWHDCLDDSPDLCINAKEDGDDDIPFGLLGILLAIPFVLNTWALFRRCKRQ